MKSAGRTNGNRSWVSRAMARLEADAQRAADTPLIRLELPELAGIDVYLKDESVQPTGSLKHRLARSLFLRAICSGEVGEGIHVVEASSGCAAIAEAYYASLLGLPFTAVVPGTTAPDKVEAIRKAGGNVHFAPPGSDLASVAAELAQSPGHHFMDQFTYAERATDWRGGDNIAQSLFAQLEKEPHPVPRWVVAGAGTGSTASTIGRFIRYRPGLRDTKLCVVDPEGSIFFKQFAHGENCPPATNSDHIEGIGRKRPSPSFIPALVDRMVSVPDEASIAAVRWLRERTGRMFGPSTGTNLVGVLALGREASERGEACSIVTLCGDRGERYRRTVYDDAWLSSAGLDLAAWSKRFEDFERGAPFATDGLGICDCETPRGEPTGSCAQARTRLAGVTSC